MGIASQVSLLVVLVVWILSSPRIAGRGHFLLFRLGGWIVGIPALIVAGVAAYLTYAQFIAWQGNAMSKYLLPPYTTISYFAAYVAFHFWGPYIVSGIVGLIVFWVARAVNKKFHERFFEHEELYFLALGILLASHPGWIMYSIVILSFYCALCVLRLVCKKEMPRISFYYGWLPCAALTIIASRYMTQFEWYADLLL